MKNISPSVIPHEYINIKLLQYCNIKLLQLFGGKSLTVHLKSLKYGTFLMEIRIIYQVVCCIYLVICFTCTITEPNFHRQNDTGADNVKGKICRRRIFQAISGIKYEGRHELPCEQDLMENVLHQGVFPNKPQITLRRCFQEEFGRCIHLHRPSEEESQKNQPGLDLSSQGLVRVNV